MMYRGFHKYVFIAAVLFKLIVQLNELHIQGVPGGMDKPSGECSLW